MAKSVRRFTLLLIIGLFCSSLISAQSVQTRSRSSRIESANIATVDFCDLTVHPELYVGKLVRVKASLVSWWESSYLYNVNCEDSERKIQNALDCSGERKCRRLGKQVYGLIERHQRPDKNNYAFRSYVTLIGRLVGPSEVGFGHLNWSKFEFRIRKAEAALPMPSEVPYASEKEGGSSQ
jgi:hypothetical protein